MNGDDWLTIVSFHIGMLEDLMGVPDGVKVESVFVDPIHEELIVRLSSPSEFVGNVQQIRRFELQQHNARMASNPARFVRKPGSLGLKL